MCSPCLPEWRGGETQGVHVHNLLEQFNPAIEADTDEGVVNIEYVFLAVAVVGVGAAVGAAVKTGVLAKLTTLFA